MNRDINKEAREQLDRLLKTDPNSLTAPDIEFLKARSDYLTDEQKAVLDKLPQQLEEAHEANNQPEGNPVNTSASAAEVNGADVEGVKNNDQTPDQTPVDNSDQAPVGNTPVENSSNKQPVNYASVSKAKLKDELKKRNIAFAPNANQKDLAALLELESAPNINPNTNV